MPRGDGTGPRGLGTMTGRGMGTCIEEIEMDESMNMKNMFMQGRRRWYGRGCCKFLGSQMSEKEMLENERDLLLRRLEQLENELK